MEGDGSMRGRFRFYQQGELVAESTNLITDAGKELILRKLADQATSLGGAIGVGVSDTAPAATDIRLGFEIARATVTVKYPNFDNFYIIYKAELPQEDEYTVYEAGLWSQGSDTLSGMFASRQLALFTSSEGWSNTTVDSTNSRASITAARVDVTAGNTVSVRRSGLSLDLSGYSSQDQFNIAFYKPDNNIAAVTLVFETTTGGGSYRSAEINVAGLPVGYHTVTVSKGSLVATGAVDWANIDRFGVDVRATTTGYVVLDGMRIEDSDTLNVSYALVSHSLLPIPRVKTNVAPLEIEYALEFNVSG